MKTLIVYSSQTGFTEKYAGWLAKELNGETLPIKEALKKEEDFFTGFDAVIYGGWISMEKITGAGWFTERIEKWKDKKLAIFAVGSCSATSPRIDIMLGRALTDEQKKYAKAFYCEGGLAYEKMAFGSKMLMKTYAAMLKCKKNKSDEDAELAKKIASSFDNTDPKFIKPVVEYIKG